MLKKVVFANLNLGNFGGIHTVLEGLATEFSARGIEIDYISVNPVVRMPSVPGNVFQINKFENFTTDHRLAKSFPGLFGIKLKAKSVLTPFWRFWRNKRLLKYFANLNEETLVIFMEPQPGDLLYRAGYKKNDSPAYLHSQFHQSFYGLQCWGQEKELKNSVTISNTFSVLSVGDVQEFSNFLSIEPLVLENPLRIPLTSSPYNRFSKDIIFLGRLAPEKNVDSVIRAFATIKDNFPDWNLRIYGTGVDEEKIRDLCEKFGDQVVFEGETNDIVKVLDSAAFMCLFSSFEGAPMVLLEASARRVPSLVRPCSPAVSAFIQDGGINAGDSEDSLADAMAKMIQDVRLREEIADRSHAWVSQSTPQLVVDRWIEMFEAGQFSRLAGDY
ncbi:glycosyltransferase [Actinomyces vulturis]|uniref:glycosyltransferase n=1 Tax=Actinomyces vulturis TaxID=1857645 RepID=UPI00082D8B25|nr:glycosyltransferase [Actinomyces vulturis]